MSFDLRKLGQALFGKKTAKRPSRPIASKAVCAPKPQAIPEKAPAKRDPLTEALEAKDHGKLMDEIARLGTVADALTSHGSQRARRLLELAEQLKAHPEPGLAVLVSIEASGLTDDAMHHAAMWRSLSKKCLHALEIMDMEEARRLVPEMQNHLNQLERAIEEKRHRLGDYSSNLESEEILQIAQDASLLSILEGEEIPLIALSGMAPHEVAARTIAQLKPIKLNGEPVGLDVAIKNRDLAAIKQISQALWS